MERLDAIAPINLAEKLSSFDETWSPRILAELNGQHVKIAKLEGEFLWHAHENEDELFLVISGALDLHLRDREGVERVVKLAPGELAVVPRGVQHKPFAHGMACVLLFEPASTVNTGEVRSERTVETPERI